MKDLVKLNNLVHDLNVWSEGFSSYFPLRLHYNVNLIMQNLRARVEPQALQDPL